MGFLADVAASVAGIAVYMLIRELYLGWRSNRTIRANIAARLEREVE